MDMGFIWEIGLGIGIAAIALVIMRASDYLSSRSPLIAPISTVILLPILLGGVVGALLLMKKIVATAIYFSITAMFCLIEKSKKSKEGEGAIQVETAT